MVNSSHVKNSKNPHVRNAKNKNLLSTNSGKTSNFEEEKEDNIM